MTYDEMMKRRGGPLAVEQRQVKLAANAEATERWLRRLFRAATELKKLAAERKRLLNPRKSDRGGKSAEWTPDKYIGSGGPGAIDSDLNDDVEGM